MLLVWGLICSVSQAHCWPSTKPKNLSQTQLKFNINVVSIEVAFQSSFLLDSQSPHCLLTNESSNCSPNDHISKMAV